MSQICFDQETMMRDTPQNVPGQPFSLLDVGPRMVQIGFDQLENALAWQAKRIQRDRTVVQHACDAFLKVRANDVGSIVQAWQTLVCEYFVESLAISEQNRRMAARTQAAVFALLGDVVLDLEKAWMPAMAQASRRAGTVPQGAMPRDEIVGKTVPGGHSGLFMGARTLPDQRPSIAEWIAG
jgi:hypothetical protein